MTLGPLTVTLAPQSGEDGPAPRGRPLRRSPWLVLLVGGLAVVAGGLVAIGGWLTVGTPQVVAETPVTDMDLRDRAAATSPMVARDPTEPAFVVAATRGDAPGPDCGLQVSGDGGISWLEIDVTASMPDAIGACYQPQVAFAADGRLVYSFVGMIGPPPEPDGVFVIVSDDRAQTFTQARRVADLDTITPRMTVSAEGIEMVWVDPLQEPEWDRVGPPWPVGSQVLVAVGDVGGLDESVVVAEPDGLAAAPTIAGDPDGVSAVAYYEVPGGADPDGGVASLAGQGPWRLMVAYRPDTQSGFGDPEQVAEFQWIDQAVLDAGLQPREDAPDALRPLLLTRWGIAEPGLAVRDGKVCVGWTDATVTELQALASCTDGDGEWSTPTMLGAGADGPMVSWLPQVAISPSGTVQAAFYGRADASDEVVGLWFASADGLGGEFTDVVPVTSLRSSPYHTPRPGWFGSRLGLASGEDAAVAMWADARNAQELRPNQVVFSAVIAASGGPGALLGDVAAWLLVGGLFVMGAGGIVALRRRRTIDERARPADVEASPAVNAGQQ